MTTTKETADQDVGQVLNKQHDVYAKAREEYRKVIQEQRDEIERLRGALRTIDSLIPKTKEITDFPYWVAIAGDIAEGALNGTWPAYGVMPAPAKEKE